MMKKGRLEKLLQDIGHAAPVSINKLHGHASYRTYYRVSLADGTSFVLMEMPQGRASASEEITNFKGKHDEIPFVNVAHGLESVGLPVPGIIHYSVDDNWLLLEDLGDDLLAMEVTNAGEDVQRRCYKTVIDLLVSLQQRSKKISSEKCVALQRSFDDTLLNWEFDHFLEYGIKARGHQTLPEKFVSEFEKCTRAITASILEMPYGFTHRDFQSRNLINHNDSIYMLDFQDALRGPYVYDLVALLRDSYVELPEQLVAELVSYYAGKMELDEATTKRDFALVTVQRKLKDAGRFVYIERVKGNPDFLQFIPTSLRYVRGALDQVADGMKFFELLRPYVPEWK